MTFSNFLLLTLLTTSQVTAVFRLGETATVLDLPRGSSSSSRDESVKSIIGVKSEQVTHESVYAMPSKQDIGLEAVDESTKNPGRGMPVPSKKTLLMIKEIKETDDTRKFSMKEQPKGQESVKEVPNLNPLNKLRSNSSDPVAADGIPSLSTFLSEKAESVASDAHSRSRPIMIHLLFCVFIISLVL